MSERRYPLLVFDWDGTLVDSAGAIVESIVLASRDLGLAEPDPERARYCIGLGLEPALRIAVPELPRERYREFSASYSRHFVLRESAMAVFASIPELLAELQARGHLLAVATGKSRRGLDRALQATGLGVFFAASRCADETSPKPHPAMLLELTGELGVRPGRTLMIGDTEHDLRMAASAGVDGLAVSYGAHPEASLRGCAPRGCVSSVEQLGLWLKTNA